jgi:hypothetical protein
MFASMLKVVEIGPGQAVDSRVLPVGIHSHPRNDSSLEDIS